MTHGLQAIQNAPLGAASMSSRRQDRDLASHPKYGMPMWFRVVVELTNGTTKQLGKWSACQNLGVKFGYDQVQSGGNHDAGLIVPTVISYGEVTLERAMKADDSSVVQEWLKYVANKWINGVEGGSGLIESSKFLGGYQGEQVVITLLSSLTSTDPNNPADHEVASWILRNAIPVSWSGPNLSAKSGGGDVAMEKLVVFHRGFLETTTSPSGTGQTQSLTMSAHSEQPNPKAEKVVFQYNPVSVDYVVKATDKSSKSEPNNIQVKQADYINLEGKLALTLSNLRVEGVTAVNKAWLTLRKWTGVDDREADRKETLLDVKLGAGRGLVVDEVVALKQVTFKCTRFTAEGVANRADVTLVLEVLKPNKPGSTPASSTGGGGAAGGGAKAKPKAGGHRGGGSNTAGAPERDLGVDDPGRAMPPLPATPTSPAF